MAQIKSKNTRPELLVRQHLHKLGIRYRIHFPIKGNPDLAFPKIKKAVFIHGCFWHNHGCNNSTIPKSNTEFWQNKIKINLERDKRVNDYLANEGWKTLVIWECDVEKDITHIGEKIRSFISS